jgi:hypothetical protein
MKQLLSKKNSTCRNKKLYWTAGLLFLFYYFGVTEVHAQEDPYTKFKEVAKTQPVLKSELPRVAIAKTNPVWKLNTEAPRTFKEFPMTDKNGRAIPPGEMIQLKDGTRMKASDFFTQLNNLERKLNATGRSLRDNKSEESSKTITASQTLDGRVSSVPVPIAKLKEGADIKAFMSPTKKVGDITLKPFDEYSAEEKKKLETYSFKDVNNQLSAQKLERPLLQIVGPPLATPLKIINETSSRDWSFGSTNSVKAGIKGDLIRYAKIYHFDPLHPDRSMSEFKVTAKGKAYGALFGHSLDFLNGSAEFYAPADVSKNMTAKISISSGGISIYNFNQSYPQHKSVSGTKARNFDKSFAIHIPIVGPLDFSGRIGAKGTVGLEYSGNLYRSFASLDANFVAELKGYAEAAICAGGILCAGVGGELTLIRGKLDLNAFAGIWVQNSEQIVAAISYYFGYDLELLKGKLYVFAEACVPDWVPFIGGSCTRYSHTVFDWSGYRKSGTIAEDTKTYLIANL